MQKEVRIGLVAVVIFVAFIMGLNFLKGKDVFTSSRAYYAVYPDVNGLQKSSPVMTNGMTVGYVGDISVLHGDMSRIVVEINVKKSLQVPQNSVMEICSADLLGTKAVRLVWGDSRQFAAPGDTLRGILENDMISGLTARLAPAAEKATVTLASIDTMVARLNRILDTDTQNNVKHIVSEFDEMVSALRPRMTALVANLESLSATLKGQDEHIAGILENVDSLSEELAGMAWQETLQQVNSAVASLQTAVDQLNSKEGTVGKLLNSDELHRSLQNSVDDLDALIKDIKEHPRDYVQFSVFERKVKQK